MEWDFKLFYFFGAWLFVNFNLENEVVSGTLSFVFSFHVLSVGLGSKPDRRKVETHIKTRLSFRTNLSENSIAKTRIGCSATDHAGFSLFLSLSNLQLLTIVNLYE